MTRNDFDPKWPDRVFGFVSDSETICYSNVLINNNISSVSESYVFLELYLQKLRILFMFFMLALFILSWYRINLLTYFWIFLIFHAETPHFPSHFCHSEGVKIAFWGSFSGLRACFSANLLQKLSLLFYLENAILYNKRNVLLFCMRLNIKEIEKKMDAIISDVLESCENAIKWWFFLVLKAFFSFFVLLFYSNGCISPFFV